MYPAKFAAVVPMSGRLLPRPYERKNAAPEILKLSDSENPCAGFAAVLKDTPIWIFHGSEDTVVPVSNSREMAKALHEVGNTNVTYTELPHTGHVSVTAAFSNSELFDWLKKQRLGQ